MNRMLALELAPTLAPEGDLAELFSRHEGIADHAPLFMNGLEPAPFWFEFGMYLARNWNDPTRRQYAYTALGFATFMNARGLHVTQVTEADISDYRRMRLEGNHSISSSSWSTDATVLRLIFDYCIETRLIDRRPWIDVGRRNAVSQPVRRQPIYRGLSESEWLTFRDVGLAGKLPNGHSDLTFAGKLAMRNVLGAQIAISTGMRVAEFHSLTLTEVSSTPDDEGGIHVRLRACAKNGRERQVYIPSRVRQSALGYIKTERKAAAQRSLRTSKVDRHRLFVVDEEAADGSSYEGTLFGERRRFVVADMPPALRLITYRQVAGTLEPLALFVNSYGRMASKSSWHRAFKLASNRTGTFPGTPQASRRVQPHTLRHTFARRMLAFLNELKSSPEGIEAGYGEIDPLVEVQRLLGHADLSTTANYVFSDSLSGAVELAFSSWTDDSKDYGALVESWLNERRSHVE